jgi:hypothetical protein
MSMQRTKDKMKILQGEAKQTLFGIMREVLHAQSLLSGIWSIRDFFPVFSCAGQEPLHCLHPYPLPLPEEVDSR